MDPLRSPMTNLPMARHIIADNTLKTLILEWPKAVSAHERMRCRHTR